MCFSFKTSLLSFCLGMLSAMFAYNNNQKGTSLFIFFYTLMQVSEMLIWSGLDNNNLDLNRVGTLIGKYTLPLHGIAIGLGLLWSMGVVTYINVIPLLIGILFALYVFVVAYAKDMPTVTYPYNKCYKPECQNWNNRLEWPYPVDWYKPLSVTFGILMMFYLKPFPLNIITPAFYAVSGLIVSYLFTVSGIIGSVWCLSTALIAPLIVLAQYMLKGFYYIL